MNAAVVMRDKTLRIRPTQCEKRMLLVEAEKPKTRLSSTCNEGGI